MCILLKVCFSGKISTGVRGFLWKGIAAFMNSNSEKDKDYMNKKSEANGEHEEYTFVRETIKEKPPVILRALIKISQILGMGIVFGIGVCFVLYVFDKDIRDFFGSGDKESVTTHEVPDETIGGEKETTGESLANIEEFIDSMLADVAVVFYEKEATGDSNENTMLGSETTAIYEEGTAAISDNKEMQTAAGNKATAGNSTQTQDETSTLQEETDASQNETEKRIIKEKKYFTGIVVDNKTNVYICISYDKVKSGDDIYVSLGKGEYITARIYGQDIINNIAVLEVKSEDIDSTVLENITAALAAEADNMGNGDELIYAGNPYGTGRLFYSGTLAGIDDGYSSYDMFYRGIITDMNGSGVSDGFLFNASGNLAAIISTIDGREISGNNIAGICMEDVMHIVKAIVYKSTINHIGIKGEPVTDDMRELTGENMPDGMYVTDVLRDSTAYKSGIMTGDIITSAGAGKVESIRDIQSALNIVKSDSMVTIVLKRKIGTGYNEFTIKVPVEAY